MGGDSCCHILRIEMDELKESTRAALMAQGAAGME